MAEFPPALNALLRETSRSFYLTMRILPAPIRPQIGLAYLLARATDTIADTDLIAVPARLEALAALRGRILGKADDKLDLAPFLSPRVQTASAGEVRLLQELHQVLALLRGFAHADQTRIACVLDVITSGQELDLRRFGEGKPTHMVALETAEELDDYTYRVAGCVGRFWTEMCSAHLFQGNEWNEPQQLRLGVDFGKGLQLVNILRDLPRDLRQGRCYLPLEDLRRASLSPTQLLEPGNWPRLQPTYEHYLARCEGFLRAGWSYTMELPRRARRLRLGCALPILIGVRTVALLRRGNPLVPDQRIKVDRPWLRRAAARTFLACWGGYDWERLYAWAPK